LERIKLECPKCGNTALVESGSYSADQSYADLNEDFAYFKVYSCPVHKGWVYRNAHDRSFDGSCSIDGGKLQAFDISGGKCPRCGGAILSMRIADPMAE
jgi:ribosomal protein S27AE